MCRDTEAVGRCLHLEWKRVFIRALLMGTLSSRKTGGTQRLGTFWKRSQVLNGKTPAAAGVAHSLVNLMGV